MFLLLPLINRLLFVAEVVAFVALTAASLRGRFLKSRRPDSELTQFIGYFSRRGVAPDISGAVHDFLTHEAFKPSPHDNLGRVYGVNSYRADEIFAEMAQKCAIALPAHWVRSNPVPLESVGDIVRGLSFYRSKPGSIWYLRNLRWFCNVGRAVRPFVQLALVLAFAGLLLLNMNSRLQINGMAFSPDGKTLAVGGGVCQDVGDGFRDFDGLTWTFDVTSGTLKRRTVFFGQNVGWLSFTPDGAHLASWQYGGSYRLQDASSGRDQGSFAVSSPWFPIGAAKHWLSYADFSNWDQSSANFPALQSPDRSVLAVSADDKLAATLKFPDSSIEIWDIAGKNVKQKINAHAQGATMGSTAFSPDDNLFAFPWKSTSVGIEYAIWNLRSRKTPTTLKSITRVCNQLVFSHDGRLIAIADDSGNIEIWNVASGGCVRRFSAY